MCGIAGFFNCVSADREKILRGMCGALSHRGPDGDGLHIDGPAGLAHRRLSIIDLECGAQPMISADGRFATVFNGEIYNYIELREDLSAAGSVFRTHSDTEVIAEGVRQWGIAKTVPKLRGMFAFAVYDRDTRTLFLARDRAGQKPLCHTKTKDGFFFASEIKALKKIPWLPRKANITALHDFLTVGYSITPDSAFEDIKHFPPGSYAELKEDCELKITRYWEWRPRPEPMSFEEALGRTREVLTDALKYHMRSDVPLAAFLSGGIDSSLVVRLLSPAMLKDLKAFTASFEDDKYDESAPAAMTAKICGAEHHILKVSSETASYELFEEIISQYDEPFGDSSCLPTHLICREMRKHVKTVFSGDGGDEMFGGYSRYSQISAIDRLRMAPGKQILRKIIGALSSVISDEHVRQFGKALDLASLPGERLFCGLHTYFGEEERKALYTDWFRSLAEEAGPTWERFNSFLPGGGAENISEQLTGVDVALNLHADYLKKVDIASSAHGLEVRAPFLDNAVLDFAARLPHRLKISGSERKILLRNLAAKEISPEIGQRSKQGFGIPFDRWCNAEMTAGLKSLLFSQEADENGVWRIIRKEAGQKLWEKFTSASSGGGGYSDISRYQVYQRVFMLASAQIWARDNKPEFPSAPSGKKRPSGPRKKLICLIGQLGNGGSERQLYLFLKHLDRAEWEPEVVVSSSSSGKWRDAISGELKVPMTSLEKMPKLMKMAKFRALAAMRKPDAVLSWSFFTNAFWKVSGGARFTGMLRGDLLIAKSRLGGLNWRLSMSAPEFIANSAMLAGELVSQGAPQEKTHVVANIFESSPDFNDEKKLAAARSETRKLFGIAPEAVVVAVIGRDAPEKDIPFFIRGFGAAAAQNPRLTGLIIGSGGEAQRGLIKELGLSDRIVLSGEAENARALLPAADIYFLSSSSEGMPNVLLEAVDAGCAPVSRDISGVRDILGGLEKQLLDEILINGGSPEEAGGKILALAESPARRKEIAAAAKALLRNFSPEIIMPKLCGIITGDR